MSDHRSAQLARAATQRSTASSLVWLVALVALVGSLVATPRDAGASARVDAAAAVSVSPASGPAASHVDVSMSAFGSSEKVDVFFDSVTIPKLGTLTASKSGTGSISVTVPVWAKPKTHTFIASGESSHLEARASFLVRTSPAPSWKVLALIYTDIDATYTAPTGEVHHVTNTMSAADLQATKNAVTAFVTQDVPLLDSGAMTPTVTVRVPSHPLATLSYWGNGYWPSPTDTAADLDPTFDAVILISDGWVIDQATHQWEFIAGADGLTVSRGVNQTYAWINLDGAIRRGSRNVFKHEFGHSILSFYDALGTAPTPTVNNHATATSYVHCGTGTYYVWQDESLDAPIPNSIYNDVSGFTHDYYSGTTALPSAPNTCLGITVQAWATGGPAKYLSPPDAPTLTGFRAGDGWVAVAWDAPSGTGDAPITSYIVTSSPGGQSVTVPAGARRAALSVPDGIAQTVHVQAVNVAGPGPASNDSATFTPAASAIKVTTEYDTAENTRLLKNAAYFGQSAADAQRTSVGVLAYLVGIVHSPTMTPIVPPAMSGPNSYTTSWSPSDQSALVSVMRQYGIMPNETQYFGVQLVGYLLALGGH